MAIETKRKQSIKQFFLAKQQLQFVISIFLSYLSSHWLCWLANRLSRFVVTAGASRRRDKLMKINYDLFTMFQNKLLLFQIRLDSRHRYLFPGLYSTF